MPEKCTETQEKYKNEVDVFFINKNTVERICSKLPIKVNCSCG